MSYGPFCSTDNVPLVVFLASCRSQNSPLDVSVAVSTSTELRNECIEEVGEVIIARQFIVSQQVLYVHLRIQALLR